MNSVSYTLARAARTGLSVSILAGIFAMGCSASVASDQEGPAASSQEGREGLRDDLTLRPIQPIAPLPPIGIKPLPPGIFGPNGCTSPSPITDYGYPGVRAYVDANGDSYTDYCRMVGDAPNIFLSCQLGCVTGEYGTTTGFDSIPGIDQGYSGTGQMLDVNKDGRADFCREVGNAGATFQACNLAGPSGFGADQYELSFPPGFAAQAPVGVVAASDGSTIDVYKSSTAVWFHGKDAAGVKHGMTLGTSGQFTTMSVVENGVEVLGMSMTADMGGYVTIYARSPGFSKNYKFYASPENLASSGFGTDFATAISHASWFQNVGANAQATMSAYMQGVGIPPASPANVVLQRAASAADWTLIACVGVALVTGGVGTLPAIGCLITALAAGGAVISDDRIATQTINDPGLPPPSDPLPPAGDDPTPPAGACDSSVQSCAAPPATGDDPGPGAGSTDPTGGDPTGGDPTGGDPTGGDPTGGGGGGGGGGSCNPVNTDFAARHAQWKKVHPLDICDNCCI